MNKLILSFLLLAAISCSKSENNGPDKADLMINASAYIGDLKGLYDIAFYPIKREDGLNNPISNTKDWVDEFFDTHEGFIAKNVEQYKEYVPRGQYHIIIRIASDPMPGTMEGKFTIKQVDVSKDPSMENVMRFSRSNDTEWYQEWEDFYKD